MGLIKEYADRAVQTDTESVPSPYADPAVVLAAPSLARRRLALDAHTASPFAPDGTYAVLQSPPSPMLAPLVSRRLSKRRHARCPAGESVNRRIVSMPENKSEILSHGHGKRVVSMPDRVRPDLEPSAELSHSPSTAAGDSFGSYGGRHERVHVFGPTSDVPQTPSPPSSPESLLIIASGTQLPEGFLRRKYSPEPLIEEDEDWIAWANSPPRPIPALHGPLSLPYARCPSGAEGTIIEEPENVAQMIWGLGPDDQLHGQARAEGLSSPHDNPQIAPSLVFSQVPPRLQKKRTPASQQVPKSTRTQVPSHTSRAKQSVARTQRPSHDEKRDLRSQPSPDIESHPDVVSGPPWSEGQSMPTNVGAPDNLASDIDVLPIDSNQILEWQLAHLRQALRTSLVDMDSYGAYPGRLDPVIPATVSSGLPQSYPRIFVEPRPNESVSAAPKQTPIEIAQQYRLQQLYRQALQKQKLPVRNILPTPPSSSSPQWSSHFSPYLTYCSTFSPELVGSAEHQVHVPTQKYRSGSNPSQYLRHVCDRHEHDNVHSFDTTTNITKTPRIPPNVSSAPPLGPSPSSSSTLAKYIKQLQALSPIPHFSPLQPIPSPNASLTTLQSTDESTASPFQSGYSSIVRTPPSPESPQTLSRGSSHHDARSMARPVQRRLSSVPEEDSAILDHSTSVSSTMRQGQITTDCISSSHDGTTGHQIRYIEMPLVDVTRKSALADLPDFECNLGVPSIALHHETSPAKVRLPVTKEHSTREPTSGYHEQNKEGHQHGHKKKHRYKKFKGPPNEQATRGLVG